MSGRPSRPSRRPLLAFLTVLAGCSIVTTYSLLQSSNETRLSSSKFPGESSHIGSINTLDHTTTTSKAATPDAMAHGPPILRPDDCSTDNLIRWCKENAASVNDLKFADFLIENVGGDGWLDDGAKRRGIMATKPYVDGQDIVTIPLALSMSMISARETALKTLIEEHPHLRSFELLALHVLYESGNPDSFWYPFLCTLPREIPLPLFWTSDKLAAKGDPKLIDDVDNTRTVIKDYYNKIVPMALSEYPTLFADTPISVETWSWACAVVMSRAWGLKPQDNSTASTENYHVLVPIADMFNHKAGSRTVSFSQSAGWLAVQASGTVEKGQELFLSYGDDKCNRRFLMNYGFEPPYNEHVECDPIIPEQQVVAATTAAAAAEGTVSTGGESVGDDSGSGIKSDIGQPMPTTIAA